MKYFLYCILCFVILSCDKHSNDPKPLSNAGYVQYNINGILTTMDNADFLNGEKVTCVKQLSGIGLPETRYVLNAEKTGHLFFSCPGYG